MKHYKTVTFVQISECQAPLQSIIQQPVNAGSHRIGAKTARSGIAYS